MYLALNMELEIVRTVLENDVNDIFVCTDIKDNTGVYYTMISIKDAKFRKMIAGQMNTSGLFFGNKDFVGSFSHEDQLNLVFRYYHESLLSVMGSVYLYSFVECKSAALAYIAAFAEAGVNGSVGLLLLKDRNINIYKDGGFQLNYFIDFSEWKECSSQEYITEVAKGAFRILDINYREKYDTPELYPDDLRLYYLKLVSSGFSTFGQIIATIRGMSDKPVEMRGFFWWIKSRYKITKNFLFRNSINTFLTILVIATLIYAAYQIGIRIRANKANANNIDYYGIETIGDVYLGDEE